MKLTDKRFWIFEFLVTISSMILGIKMPNKTPNLTPETGCKIGCKYNKSLILSGFLAEREGFETMVNIRFTMIFKFTLKSIVSDG